jgi:phosphatidylinositol alpha-1,6-mannosyltransferase
MNEGRGGICEVARLTMRALADRYDVSALACMEMADFQIDDMPVRAFQGSRSRFAFNLVLRARRATHIFYDFAGTARAQQLIKWPARPYAVWVHGWELWGEPRRDYQEAITRADVVFVNSAYTMERAWRTLKRAKSVRLCKLATSINQPPRVVGPSDGSPTVLLLGRMDCLLAKGHDILISIWPRVVSAVPDARLILAGGGDATERVRDFVKASSVARSIEVQDFISNQNLDELWRSATVFAMPGFAEGFGLVYIEAMRRGLPIIASLQDAGQEINVDGETGFNISREAPDQIAHALIELLRDNDLSRRLGAAGHARWRKYFRFSNFEERFKEATMDFLAA